MEEGKPGKAGKCPRAISEAVTSSEVYSPSTSLLLVTLQQALLDSPSSSSLHPIPNARKGSTTGGYWILQGHRVGLNHVRAFWWLLDYPEPPAFIRVDNGLPRPRTRK
ncbi:hypothetical protein AGABI1DRAFT_134540 [Agaricus bisporus var. burnettii JB137-S8]|uniref:Uncharacterized protein n=1 Tax=Agaricus bisporus var. burnettii (strain JB137-S8 / ATCC MYA-4627 / FGSC 10392) TaxID=597362 RepID=K5WE65_AGABU|nr:uncharacterized protein AGABI1DRAFT_134540 [Agaricus bisporus var. burnettii JB137-S8]EKM73546.1 hypothetical protein AGABI1DRAFT_134540 [Agaricus bisporus var. burnettii JB137-S8]